MAASRELSQDKPAERYSSLLIPIRDLAQNWNVDVAALLEEYLSELPYVRISFEDDPNSETMNFVEAALLIQSSACVYSKKVDYLFNLVVQLLDHLKCKSSNLITSRKRVVIKNVKTDDEFSSYDNIVPDKNIRLKENDATDLNAFTITRMPLSFFSFDKEEDSFSIYDTKQLPIGNRHDFKTNCWQNSFFKSVCTELEAIKLNSCVKESKQIVSTVTPAVVSGSQEEVNSDIDDRGDDFDDSHDIPEDHLEDIDSEPEREVNSKSVQKLNSSLVTGAEKALKEWDPLYAHEDIKRRLRPVRKGRITINSSMASKYSKKKKVLNIAACCNQKLFSRTAKLPKSIADQIDDNEALANIISKENLRRKNLKSEQDKEKENEESGGPIDKNSDSEDDFISNDFESENADNDNFFISPLNTNKNDEIDPKIRHQFDTTFDAFISKHTEEYLEKVAHQQELSESDHIRKKWEEYLLDKLEDEDRYVAYNVREYSAKVLNGFVPNSAKQTITFTRLANSEADKGEVVRLFFASLQLANNYNVKIDVNSTCGRSSDDIELTLLSRIQNFDALENI